MKDWLSIVAVISLFILPTFLSQCERVEPDICFGKGWEEVRHLRHAKVVSEIMMLCLERYFPISEHMVPLAMQAAYYDYEKLGTDCRKKRLASFKKIDEGIVKSFKSDGEEKFCTWARAAYDAKNSELFLRFEGQSATDALLHRAQNKIFARP